jgi:hypothetical protein
MIPHPYSPHDIERLQRVTAQDAGWTAQRERVLMYYSSQGTKGFAGPVAVMSVAFACLPLAGGLLMIWLSVGPRWLAMLLLAWAVWIACSGVYGWMQDHKPPDLELAHDCFEAGVADGIKRALNITEEDEKDIADFLGDDAAGV